MWSNCEHEPKRQKKNPVIMRGLGVLYFVMSIMYTEFSLIYFCSDKHPNVLKNRITTRFFRLFCFSEYSDMIPNVPLHTWSKCGHEKPGLRGRGLSVFVNAYDFTNDEIGRDILCGCYPP